MQRRQVTAPHRGAIASLAVLFAAWTGAGASAASTEESMAQPLAIVAHDPAALVGRLLVAEVVTGGAWASDEWVEIHNAGPIPADLAGLEVVYVTSTGGTLSRKQAWTSSLLLASGQRLLLANADGLYASIADGLYAGGLSATGGTIALRTLDGTVLDSLSWGTASSSWVEGTAGPAPPPGWSLERGPGGPAGNWWDTDDNLTDTLVQPFPVPQALADPPTPIGSDPPPSEPPTASPEPTATGTPTASLSPTPSPTPTPVPTPTPSPTPTLVPTPTPVAIVPIAEARGRAVGASISIRGVVTVEPGRLLAETVFAVQDASGGIVVRLPSGTVDAAIARGDLLEISGVLADPYGNLEVRPTADGWSVTGTDALPPAGVISSDAVGEPLEGTLARITGDVRRIETGSSGSFAVTLADARGEARVFVFGSTGIGRDRFVAGQRLRATGIVGQRESSGDANDGHRLWPRDVDDLVILAEPTPAPTATLTPRPTATPTPRPSSSSAPTPTPSADSVSSIADAIRRGGTATIRGHVTAPAGLLDSDGRRVTVQDRSGAVLLRLPQGEPAPSTGTEVRVSGALGTYYGGPQLEAAGSPTVLGRGSVTPVVLRRPPGQPQEWSLVRVTGSVTDVTRSGTSWRAELVLSGGGGALPVAGLSASGIPVDTIVEGRAATVTGLVRRAFPTASDQRFAVVPRTAADVVLGAAGGGGASGGGPGGGSPSDGSDPGLGGAGSSARPGEPGAPVPGGSGAIPGAIGTGSGTGAVGSAVPPSGPITDIDLADIADFDGWRVRVGGRVTTVSHEAVTIHDGTAGARLRPRDGPLATDLVPGPGTIVNAVGVVASSEAGWTVVLESLADIVAPARVLTVAAPSAIEATASSEAPAPGPTITPDAADIAPRSTDRGSILALLMLLVGTALPAAAGAWIWWRRRPPAERGAGMSDVEAERA